MAISNQELVAFLKKNLIVSVAGALCLALVVALYFRSDTIPAATALLDEKTAEAGRLAANIKNSAQLSEQLARLAAANKEVNERLVRVGQKAINQQYFYKLEAETGLKLIDLRQNTETSQGAALNQAAKTEKIPVSFGLTLQGDYQKISDFLRRVESGSHFCRVMSAVVEPVSESGARSNQAKLTLNLEFLGEP